MSILILNQGPIDWIPRRTSTAAALASWSAHLPDGIPENKIMETD